MRIKDYFQLLLEVIYSVTHPKRSSDEPLVNVDNDDYDELLDVVDSVTPDAERSFDEPVDDIDANNFFQSLLDLLDSDTPHPERLFDELMDDDDDDDDDEDDDDDDDDNDDNDDNDGLADTSKWKLTYKGREDRSGAYTPKIRNNDHLKVKSDRDLRSHIDISEKELFYNSAEREQIERISVLISKEGFENVKTRLSESGLRCGICCLLYGAPGTGKTETVLQLARRTGRDIFQVNIAGLRDKFVGESEKNIKMVFNRYKRSCQCSEHIPILLFNEADAIFGCRFETLHSSVEKMDNAIQNIILQEMETFEGIMIATTNLTDNLDSAFDRRFLYKVEFTNPGVEARAKIWHSLLPEMDIEECAIFAKEFNLSGGQIENVARKCKIEYVLTGVSADNSKISKFCKEEYLTRRTAHRRVGF